MKRWILCCALLVAAIAGVGGLVAERRAGAEADIAKSGLDAKGSKYSA